MGWSANRQRNVVTARNKIQKNGATGEIRTPDTLVRSQVLYPAELRSP